jgi:hypothetical protein
MLIIRRDQIQSFIASDDAELIDEVARSVRYAVGDRVASYDDEQLYKMVAIGVERARSNKLTAAEDIAAFVAIMFEVAPRFDEQKEISAALDNEILPISDRLMRLSQMTLDQSWTDAERRYEDSFWFPDEEK